MRRVAFVSQPGDAVVPPQFNSVGLITARLSQQLAANGDTVVVHGTATEASAAAAESAGAVRLRLSAGTRGDRAVRRAWPYVAAGVGAARGGLRPPLSTSPRSAPSYLRHVVRDITKNPPDVLHVQQCVGYLPRLRRAAPDAALVLHLHADWYPQTPTAALRRWTRDVDAVICVSRHVRDGVAALLPEVEERLHVVHNGVDPAAPSSPLRADAPPALVYVGAIAPHRGLHVAVRAFTQLAGRFPDAVLRLVGPFGNYPKQEVFPLSDRAVRSEVRRLYAGDYVRTLLRDVPPDVRARIELTGPLPYADGLAQIARATVLVFPTIFSEGFGLPLVEAMAAGVPVVASRVGAVGELVADGETGLLVDVNDADGFGEALGRLLGDPGLRRAMGQAASRRSQAFQWPLVASAVRGVHDVALARRATSTENPAGLPAGASGVD